jgi:putative PEP-CTERM system histidine kinase
VGPRSPLTDIEVLGHGLAAAAFLILSLLLLVGWRGRAAGARLIVAVAITATWAALLTALYLRGGAPVGALAVLEYTRYCAWLAVLGGLATSGGVARWAVRTSYALAGIGLALALGRLGALGPVREGLLLLIAGLAFPLFGLVLLEQVYRNAHASGRLAIRPLFIGLGAMYVFDLFMYCEAVMTLRVSAEALAARGFVYAACVPAIALAARRNPDWSLDVFVSRQAVFYSTTFIAVGAYLVAMSAGGYLLARFGGEWAQVVQLLFLAGAGIVLAVLVGSGAARSRLRVFLSKHFYSNKYDYRVEWLRFVRALEEGSGLASARSAMIGAVAQIVSSHFGTMWVRADGDQRFVLASQWSDSGRRDADFAAIEARSEFVEYLEKRQWIIDLLEQRRAPEVYENLRLPDALAAAHDLRIFVPLMHGGRLVGLLGLGTPDEPFSMTYEDRDLLKTVGRHIGTHIVQLEADRRLAESRQFETYSRLTAFLMHDLKNLVAQLSLVVANAEKHRRNPEFVDDAIDTIRNSTDRMTRLIEQLQRGEIKSVEREIPLQGVLARVVERTRSREPAPTLDCPDQAVYVAADPERLAVAIEHAVRNGQDATSAGGTVSIRLAQDRDQVVIQVADSGAGMSAEFIRDRLFRPFDSTKGSKGMGIGAYQVRDYVRSLRGDVSVASSPGAGTVFTITLPVAGLPGEH